MRRTDDTPLDPVVERELAALDAALAGEPVAPDLAGLASLAQAARAARPEISDSFALELEERVAAGFPPPPRLVHRVVAPVRGRLSRRMLLPAMGAAASVLVAVVVATSLIGGSSDKPAGVEQLSGPASTAPERDATGGAGAAGGGGASEAERVAPAQGEDLKSTVAPSPPARGRRVERDASLTLLTASDKVDDVADGVIRATDEVGGIVVTSSMSSGNADQGGATFTLRVPSRRLDDALARLSKLAHVRTRTQNSQDVTGSFVSAQERLDASLAERKGLLRQLARADTPNETASVRERLRIVQAEISAARSEVARLRTQTDFARIAVTVEPNGSSGGATGGGKWTPGDALDDAVRVLEVFAGVALVGAAVLAPFLLLGFGAAFGARGMRRRRREQALETG
jgi:Domain of unknown function (DUF4349)